MTDMTDIVCTVALAMQLLLLLMHTKTEDCSPVMI